MLSQTGGLRAASSARFVGKISPTLQCDKNCLFCCSCPSLARNGSVRSRRKCLLLGVEQTWLAIAATSEFDPNATSSLIRVGCHFSLAPNRKVVVFRQLNKACSRGAHATARVHHASRRLDLRVAARGAGAAVIKDEAHRDS
jgi:hypothetical protein